ncbi:MAG: PorT family protein [Muribaculaceae bacterium]|nr:PorT family protein [Muribaculaceae bacterium]
MKKIAIAFVCMIMAAGVAMAQPEKTFTFGPKIGVDYTHYWGKDCKHGGQLNYQAGLFFEYVVANKFSIAPEVVFAAQGGKYHGEFDGYKTDVTEHVNYVNVPVMLKYYVAPSLSIDFGPQLGINVYSKYTWKYSMGEAEFKETVDQKDYTKTVDFGVGLGLTYNIAKDVFVQGRYTLGVTKMFKGDADCKNGNAQIAIGYRF